MTIELVRHSYLDNVTLGRLFVDGLILETLEEPWLADPNSPGGQQGSCVPDGTYTLVPHNSAKHPNTWALVNWDLAVYHQPIEIPRTQIHARSAILIHAGNTVTDTEGCILVGMRHGFIGGEHSVLESRNALEHLRAVLGAGNHILIIRPTTGTGEKNESAI